eukprot:TRINITY_DN5753_c0_g1_i1.p1 TRINITY_DN5753_c0_g1~~TRINITY_DN5753_c0_g1_i1.p1  ORF type:complete len:269 (+),score=61.58 TRINITY_DN5753_c0_g1_i1:54-860(+)
MASFQKVVRAVEQIAPLRLADCSWDNVGVMVENPKQRNAEKVMLTIDFTKEVLEECVGEGVGVVVAYHPPIFRPMKCLKMSDYKSMLLLESVVSGMSIYSPHSALDSTHGGINDWLCEGLNTTDIVPITPDVEDPAIGVGRTASFPPSTTIADVIQSAKKSLNLENLRVAFAPGTSLTTPATRVAVCAGSGASVVRLAKNVDIYYTGEMSHHEVLAANAAGITCILSEHTLTERGYLEKRFKPALEAILGAEYTVMVSKKDANPINIV